VSTSVIHTLASAKKFNQTAASSLDWGGKFPIQALKHHPDFGKSYDSDAFAQEVIRFQTSIYGASSPNIDGKLGRSTWAEVLKRFDFIPDEEAFWVLKDRRIRVEGLSTPIFNFDQKEGLDLHRFGHFSSRRVKKPHLIVVHWGGLDPFHCYRVFSDLDRKVSSHAGIGLDAKKQPAIYQWLDLQHTSWHGGWVNHHSIGIDICQQPDLKWKDHYTQQGYNIQVMDNPTDRGSRKVLSLDPRIAQATREAVFSLCTILDIPYVFPKAHEVQDKDYLLNKFSGVIGHHHITDNKWDIACWWDLIF